MFADSPDALEIRKEVEARLDGNVVAIPVNRRSLKAVCCHLETVALQRQRVLCSMIVDGQPADLAQLASHPGTFCRIDATTAALDQPDLVLLFLAQQQSARILARVNAAVAQVLINEFSSARELWWKLAGELKEPLLTLSLLPENAVPRSAGVASSIQLRKWQLEQLSTRIQQVNAVIQIGDVAELSNALEKHIVPWLQNLCDLIPLWLGNALTRARRLSAPPPRPGGHVITPVSGRGRSDTQPSF